MSGKLIGAALVIGGGLIGCYRWIKERRRQVCLVQELAAALNCMEGMIRWQNLPITRVLEIESTRKPGGKYFKSVHEYMKGGLALQEAWQQTFSELPDNRCGDLMCRMDLQGDTQKITGTIHLTTQELRSYAAERALHQQETERLCVAVWGCLSTVLVVVLI